GICTGDEVIKRRLATSEIGTFATCSELVRMSVDRGRPEVAAARSKRRFGRIASIVGEADGTGIPLANPKTAYSLRGIVPQIRRPRAERGACQSGSDALLGGAAAALRARAPTRRKA